MKQKTIFLILFLSAAFSACSPSAPQEADFVPADTTASFKIDSYWLTPNKYFDYNSLKQSSGDTLHLVTCSEYVYFPFGKLTDQSSLKTSLLKDFAITNFKRDTFTNINIDPPFFQWDESIELKLGSNKLSLFLDNDPEASTHGYIRGGEIVDSQVAFLHDIQIGMSTEDFYNKFFDHFPKGLLKKYKVVEFESCVQDVTHIYTFDEGRLNLVRFISE